MYNEPAVFAEQRKNVVTTRLLRSICKWKLASHHVFDIICSERPLLGHHPLNIHNMIICKNGASVLNQYRLTLFCDIVLALQ